MELTASRPYMPGYGIHPAAKGSGLLPWSFVAERMAAARNYWVNSTRTDGRPHAAPVWGLWHVDAFFFSSGKESRKADNLTANPAAIVHLESGDEVVILEGEIETLDAKGDKDLLAALDKAYKAKYQFPMVGMGNIYRLKPQRVFAWREADFPGSATRWQAA
jgi:hypothetical protein